MPVKDYTITIYTSEGKKDIRSYSQVCQDLFALYVCDKFKGTYLEIGSNHPMINNNTYKLYKEYNWNGIMVEYDEQYLELYKQIRPTDTHIIQDARTVDYREAIKDFPKVIDYLSIDTEGNELEILNTIDFTKYDIKAITVENNDYDDKFHKFFSDKKDYKFVTRLGCDEVYIKL
jgi:hypothetical protein